MNTTALIPFKKRIDKSVKIKYADFLPSKKESGISYNDFIPLMKLFTEGFARKAAAHFYGNAKIQVLDRFKYYTGRFYDSFFYNFVVENKGIRIKLDMDKMQAIAPYWKAVNRGSRPRHVDVDVLKDWIRKKREFGDTSRGGLYKEAIAKAKKTYLTSWKGSSDLTWGRMKMGLRKDIMSFYKLNPITHASMGRMSDEEAAEKIQAAILKKGTKSSRFKLMGQRRKAEFEPSYLKYENFIIKSIHDSNKEWLSKEIDKYKKTITTDVDLYRVSFTDANLMETYKDFSRLFDLIFSAWFDNLKYELTEKVAKKLRKPKEILDVETGSGKIVKRASTSATFAPIYAIAPENIDSILKKYFSGILKYYSRVYPKTKAVENASNVIAKDLIEKYLSMFRTMRPSNEKIAKELNKTVWKLFTNKMEEIRKELLGKTEDITAKPEVKEFLENIKSGLMKTRKKALMETEVQNLDLAKELINDVVKEFLQRTGLDVNKKSLEIYMKFMHRLYKLLLKGK